MSTLLDTTTLGVRSVDNRSDAYTYKIETTLVSQDIDNNQSTIKVEFFVKGVKTYYSQWDDGDATWVTSTNNSASIDNSSAIRSLKSTTLGSYVSMGSTTNTYNHKSDGSLTISTTITYGFFSTSYLPYQATITTPNVVVTTIPRASKFDSTISDVQMPNSTTIKYSGYTTSFTDILTWSYGSYSGQLDSSASSTSQKTFTFTPSNITDICTIMASRTSAVLTITLTTKNGSTTIGTATTTAKVTITASTATMTFGNVTSDNATTLGLSNCMIAGYGTGTMTASVASSHSAYDKATYTIKGVSASKGSASLGTLPTINLGVMPSSASNYTSTITFTYSNTRGATGSATFSLSVKGYSAPSITNYYANRNGTTITMGWTYTYTSLGSNAIQTHTIKLGSGSAVSVNSGSETTATLATTSSSSAVFTLSDKITSVSVKKAVPRLQVPISLYDGGGSTLATSFGEQATSYGSDANYVNFASGTKLRVTDDDSVNILRDAWKVVRGELSTSNMATLDADDLTDGGSYCVSGDSTNIPVAEFGVVIVITARQNIIQYYTKITTSSSEVEKVWIRKYRSSTETWSAWKEIVKTFDLLWTNSSPSSKFSAQTISLDLSAYDFIAVTFRRSNTNTSYEQTYVFKKGIGGALITLLNSLVARYITSSDDSGIVFTTGYIYSTYGTGTANSAYCIPTEIYGVK